MSCWIHPDVMLSGGASLRSSGFIFVRENINIGCIFFKEAHVWRSWFRVRPLHYRSGPCFLDVMSVLMVWHSVVCDTMCSQGVCEPCPLGEVQCIRSVMLAYKNFVFVLGREDCENGLFYWPKHFLCYFLSSQWDIRKRRVYVFCNHL